MKALDRKQREFVALGAALASNCIPCIEYHVAEALKAGIGPSQIREAVKLADTVRKVPARQVLGTAFALLEGPGAEDTNGDAGSRSECGCS